MLDVFLFTHLRKLSLSGWPKDSALRGRLHRIPRVKFQKGADFDGRESFYMALAWLLETVEPRCPSGSHQTTPMRNRLWPQFDQVAVVGYGNHRADLSLF